MVIPKYLSYQILPLPCFFVKIGTRGGGSKFRKEVWFMEKGKIWDFAKMKLKTSLKYFNKTLWSEQETFFSKPVENSLLTLRMCSRCQKGAFNLLWDFTLAKQVATLPQGCRRPPTLGQVLSVCFCPMFFPLGASRLGLFVLRLIYSFS